MMMPSAMAATVYQKFVPICWRPWARSSATARRVASICSGVVRSDGVSAAEACTSAAISCATAKGDFSSC